MEGSLVYVMGPSGAGKDSVLGRARVLLPPKAPVVFAHRYITRPADIGGENHVAVTRAEFAMRRAYGVGRFPASRPRSNLRSVPWIRRSMLSAWASQMKAAPTAAYST